MRRTLVALLALTLLTSAACFRPRGEEPVAEPPRIEVRNRHFGAIVAYLVSGGDAVRLGMVQSNRTEAFDFPVGVNPWGPDIPLLADPIGGFETYTSDALSIASGTTVVFTVENEIRHSNVMIR